MSGIEALVEAAKSGDVAQVRDLISTDPRLLTARLPSGESPLIAALYRGHTSVVTVLIESGAELDVFAAAATGNMDGLARALTQPGAVEGFAFDGWTPLHLAAFFGQAEAATTLLDAGADVHAVSRNGMRNTPLHAATAGKHERIARMLIARGADPNAIDAGGFTPLAIARENGLALEDR
jgi:ankyrin repeat protein